MLVYVVHRRKSYDSHRNDRRLQKSEDCDLPRISIVLERAKDEVNEKDQDEPVDGILDTEKQSLSTLDPLDVPIASLAKGHAKQASSLHVVGSELPMYGDP